MKELFNVEVVKYFDGNEYVVTDLYHGDRKAIRITVNGGKGNMYTIDTTRGYDSPIGNRLNPIMDRDVSPNMAKLIQGSFKVIFGLETSLINQVQERTLIDVDIDVDEPARQKIEIDIGVEEDSAPVTKQEPIDDLLGDFETESDAALTKAQPSRVGGRRGKSSGVKK